MDFNGIDPVENEEQSRNPFRNHRLRRGVYLLPTFLTVGNLLCGYYAILATLEGQLADFDNAAKAIGIAIVCDTLDGRVARLMRTNSELGKELDSLADVISFGVAPAFLAYAWGVRAMALASGAETSHLLQIGWLVGFFYLGCSVWRLARFNIQGMAPGSSRYFVGMPTPAAAGLIAATVHFFEYPISDARVSALWLLIVMALGVLMSSTLRHYSFKEIQWARRYPSLAVVLLAVLVGGIVRFSRPVLLAIAVPYSVHGIVLQLVRMARQRTASRHA